METTYLPGEVRQRIRDLMGEHHITQVQLAGRIGATESRFSRFMTGKSDNLGHEEFIRIARVFNVSVDFLLGQVEISDRKQYEITELGLSAQAARNLYTHKVQPDVVNRLLESPRFGEVTYMIQQYFDDTVAKGVAVHNQLLTTIGAMLRGSQEQTDAQIQTIRAVNLQRVPRYQADLTTIQNQFMAALKEVKQELGTDVAAAQMLTKEITQKMFAQLTRGQDRRHIRVTPAQLAKAVAGTVSGMEGVEEDSLQQLEQALQTFLQSTLQPGRQKAGESHAAPHQ